MKEARNRLGAQQAAGEHRARRSPGSKSWALCCEEASDFQAAPSQLFYEPLVSREIREASNPLQDRQVALTGRGPADTWRGKGCIGPGPRREGANQVPAVSRE